MKINKYRLGTTIDYKPWSFEQLGYAPAYMTAKHEATQKDLFDTDNGLDFEYFEQDNPYVEPKVKALRNQIDQTANQLAKAGVNPQLQEQLINLKRQYAKETGPHGTLGRASKAYSDAMNQWAEWKKANPKASEAYQEKAKQRFFGAYKGMMDPVTNKYVGFTPGRITGERDIMSDFMDYAKQTGQSGALQEILSGKVKVKPMTYNGETFLQVEESAPGAVVSNKDQLNSLVNQFYQEYTNPNVDRGLYADIAGLDRSYIANTLSNLSNASYDEKYAMQPRWNASLTHVPTTKPTSVGTGNGLNFPYQSNVAVDPKIQKEVDNDLKIMQGAFVDKGNFNKSLAVGKHTELSEQIVDPLKRLVNSITYDPKNPNKQLLPTGYKASSERAQETWDKYKKEFNSTYDDYQEGIKSGKPAIIDGKEIKNDEDWFNAATAMKQKKAALLGSTVALSNYGTYNDIYNKAANAVLVKKDDPDETMSFDEGMKVIKSQESKTGFGAKDRWAGVDGEGNLIITLPTGKGDAPNEEYIVKNASLDANSAASNSLKAITALINDYEFTRQQISQINNTDFMLSNDSKAKLYINPENSLDRKILYQEKVLDPTGTKFEWVTKGTPSLSELRANQAQGINYILQTKTDKK